MKSTVIVFYSKHGNTKAGAMLLGEKWHFDVIELQEIHTGNFIQAIFKKRTKLKEQPWNKIKAYDHIVLMSPIWASNGVPAINAFVDKVDWHHKEVTIITFQMFNDLKNSDQVHRYLSECIESKGGIIIGKYALLGGKMNTFAGIEAIRSEIEKVNFEL